MKVVVLMGMDEMYPVYSVNETSGDEVEVDEATVERWWRVQAEFISVQDEMKAAWQAHEEVAR